MKTYDVTALENYLSILQKMESVNKGIRFYPGGAPCNVLFYVSKTWT